MYRPSAPICEICGFPVSIPADLHPDPASTRPETDKTNSAATGVTMQIDKTNSPTTHATKPTKRTPRIATDTAPRPSTATTEIDKTNSLPAPAAAAQPPPTSRVAAQINKTNSPDPQVITIAPPTVQIGKTNSPPAATTQFGAEPRPEPLMDAVISIIQTGLRST
jgi:hypothetical protein